MVRVEWNHSVFEEIRRRPEVQSLVQEHCADVAGRASDAHRGAKFDYSTMQGRSRFRGIVFPANFRARRSNAKHNTLLKVLGS